MSMHASDEPQPEDRGLFIERYGRRNWAVVTAAGELLVVAVYRKGATAVVEHVTALHEQLQQVLSEHR
jgi:hypothetical protein